MIPSSQISKIKFMTENIAQFRFYEELNDLLPHAKQKVAFPYQFKGTPSIKDAVEAIGVPHTEVDLILVNGNSVGFDYQLQPGDRVSVYPVFESLDIAAVTNLRPNPLRQPKFILDVHLGKLARLLRMLGFDSLYRNDFHDHQMVELAQQEMRIILTRDRGLLKNKTVTHGYWIRSHQPDEQVREVVRRFDLGGQIRAFSRCRVCNGRIEIVDRTQIEHLLLPKTSRYYDEFHVCVGCGRVYWKGSHYQRMKTYIERFANRTERL